MRKRQQLEGVLLSDLLLKEKEQENEHCGNKMMIELEDDDKFYINMNKRSF